MKICRLVFYPFSYVLVLLRIPKSIQLAVKSPNLQGKVDRIKSLRERTFQARVQNVKIWPSESQNHRSPSETLDPTTTTIFKGGPEF